MRSKKISYAKSGVKYESLDPAKKRAQIAAKSTSIHLSNYGFQEVESSRGEAAFVWRQGKIYMASVTESLGTKNLVADEMRKVTGKTYYDTIGHDTVASIINDLISVGAKPLVIHAFWAVGDSTWFDDSERIIDMVYGWKSACDIAGATWGGGETPSYNEIINKDTAGFGGSAVGIISNKNRLLMESKLQSGDRILLLKSNGINANGLSLARAVATQLSKGYATKMSNGMLFGDAILARTNIYSHVVQDLLDAGIALHYISNITGHGLRKLMRARLDFSYVIENIFKPQELFTFIQQQSHLSEEEIYGILNMGQDYALFLPEHDVKQAQEIIKKNKFKSLDAGYIEKGKRQVIIKPKNITYSSDKLDLR